MLVLATLGENSRLYEGRRLRRCVAGIINFDGFVKSPDAALRCILRHCGVRKVRLIPQDLRALPANLFTKPSKMTKFSTAYGFINFGGKEK